MVIVRVEQAPKKTFTCLALVRKGSSIANEWNLKKRGYCIYEYDKSCDTREIRWGDGSWQELEENHYADLVLLPELDDSVFDENLSA